MSVIQLVSEVVQIPVKVIVGLIKGGIIIRIKLDTERCDVTYLVVGIPDPSKLRTDVDGRLLEGIGSGQVVVLEREEVENAFDIVHHVPTESLVEGERLQTRIRVCGGHVSLSCDFHARIGAGRCRKSGHGEGEGSECGGVGTHGAGSKERGQSTAGTSRL